MQWPILSGIFSDENGDFRTSYPRNLVPVPKSTGVSGGYLRPGEGITVFGTGPGIDRGGINWSGNYYRVMGSDLVFITTTGNVNTISGVGGNPQQPCKMDYSFDLLGISSAGNLYLYNGLELKRVTDPNLGQVIDFIWIDGYFMTTDGQFLVVTNLNIDFNDLTNITNPVKYASSEVDPDPIKALLKLRNEAYAINRYTIEVFNNVGGVGFPFQRINGGQIRRGSIGTHSCCTFQDSAIAFVGGGRNESISVWLGVNGSSTKIATREIDQILMKYNDGTLNNVTMEERIDEGHQFLYIHLPDQTLVYDHASSNIFGTPVWFKLTTGIGEMGQYRCRNFVRVYNGWHCGDPTSSNLGLMDKSLSSHYGVENSWEFQTSLIYNKSNAAIFKELELVSLSGRVDLSKNPKIWTQYSLDGETWSQERFINAGKQGERAKRLSWRRQGRMRQFRTQRFRGTSHSHLSFARLEAELEPLVYG
jgi:hypothetical protein